MTIPSLSKKTSSPQSWKKRSVRHIKRPHSNFGKTPRRKKTLWSQIKDRLPDNFTRLALTTLVVVVALGGIFSLTLVAWIAKDLPDPNRIIDRTVAESTKIYDRTGETLLFDVHGTEQRTVVKLEDLPDYVINATLTAEDRNFYDHRGISITGIIRSAIKNLFTGSRVGGSTLTQQLVKNAVLSPEKTYTRKIKEVILSWQIEKRFSKDEILQLYFNEIPYGSVAYGAEAAAQTYFGKSIRSVSLAEAAILAALPQAPTRYSPYGSNIDALFGRQRWILDSMAELGYITEEDANFAKQEEIIFKERRDDIIAPHFVMHVREYLTEKYGELAVEQGGLQVITTLDLFKHNLAQEVIDELAEKNLAKGATNAALVAIDPKTGQILTMIGSKDYFDEEIDGQVNVATRLRQPGSSFKPVVYAAALKKGYTPNTIFYDVVTKFQNYDLKDYEPKNYNLKEYGPVTMTQALAGSLNIPAVKAIYLTGVDNVIDLAEDLGYTSFGNRSRFGLSLVLGGGEVQLLEHVAAYGAFAREGEYQAPTAILEVRDKNGEVLEKYESKNKKVLATQVARQINKMLSDNEARTYIFGANNFLTLGGRPVAAKTGTTNDYRDAWTVGYTPSLAVGVWVGNNDNTPMGLGADGGVVAAPIWNSFMRRVLGDTPIEAFKEPDEVKTGKPVLDGTIAQGVTLKVNKTNGKIATNQTPVDLIEEKTYKQVHSILHYINKDDPQGNSAPDRSSEQYKRWEEAVARWAEENNIISEEPPTEIDTFSDNPDRPQITIISPINNSSVANRQLTAAVDITSTRNITKVEYYLDGNLAQITSSPPFNLNVLVADPEITAGFHRLRAVAYDDLGLPGDASVNLNFQVPSLPGTIKWLSPQEGFEISRDDFPYAVSGELFKPEDIAEIKILINGSEVARAISFPGGKLFTEWKTPPAAQGNYDLSAKIINKDGYTYQTTAIPIKIN